MNKNQLLILSELSNNNSSISSALIAMSEKRGIPLSSLKLNSRILIDLGLIDISADYGIARLSDGGRLVLSLIGDNV